MGTKFRNRRLRAYAIGGRVAKDEYWDEGVHDDLPPTDPVTTSTQKEATMTNPSDNSNEASGQVVDSLDPATAQTLADAGVSAAPATASVPDDGDVAFEIVTDPESAKPPEVIADGSLIGSKMDPFRKAISVPDGAPVQELEPALTTQPSVPTAAPHTNRMEDSMSDQSQPGEPSGPVQAGQQPEPSKPDNKTPADGTPAPSSDSLPRMATGTFHGLPAMSSGEGGPVQDEPGTASDPAGNNAAMVVRPRPEDEPKIIQALRKVSQENIVHAARNSAAAAGTNGRPDHSKRFGYLSQTAAIMTSIFGGDMKKIAAEGIEEAERFRSMIVQLLEGDEGAIEKLRAELAAREGHREKKLEKLKIVDQQIADFKETVRRVEEVQKIMGAPAAATPPANQLSAPEKPSGDEKI